MELREITGPATELIGALMPSLLDAAAAAANGAGIAPAAGPSAPAAGVPAH